jgi:serine/threonine protein kinase
VHRPACATTSAAGLVFFEGLHGAVVRGNDSACIGSDGCVGGAAAIYAARVSSMLGPGAAVGRYVIIERIGSGGMAEIYRAQLKGDYGYKKQVVLKMVLPHLAGNEDYAKMFLDECRVTSSLAHPNLPQTYELGRYDGRHFLAMEFVSGVSLWHLVQRSRERRVDLPQAVAFRLVCQLLECLHYVHGACDEDGRPLHIVHRDVSPGNLLISDDGAIKLLDFGIARTRFQEHHTAVGTVKGKMGFMSPEQARGDQVDHRTDIYAAGSLLYLLCVGVGPFEHLSEVFAILQATAAGNYRAPSKVKGGLSPALERVILKALETNAQDRYISAGTMLDELEQLAQELRIVPSSRAVAALMRELFPERAPQARTLDASGVGPPPLPLPPLPSETTADQRPGPSPGRGRAEQNDTIAETTEAADLSRDSNPYALARSTGGALAGVSSPGFPDEKTAPLGNVVRAELSLDSSSSDVRALGVVPRPLDTSRSRTARAGFPALKELPLPWLIAAGVAALILMMSALYAVAKPAHHTKPPLRDFSQPR